MRRLLGRAVLVVPVAACCSSGGSQTTADAVHAVTFDTEGPPRFPAPAQAAAPCEAAARRSVDKPVLAGNGHGGGIALSSIRDLGGRPCRFTGRRGLRLVEKDGPRLFRAADSLGAQQHRTSARVAVSK